MIHHGIATRAVALALLLLLAGCVTSPPPQGAGAASAYSVGDRDRLAFDEIVVSLRFRGADQPYQNLHVAVAVFVNPVRRTHVSPYDARGIVERCEARVAARLSEVLGAQGEQSLDTTERLRELARAEAQAVIDDAMSRWQHGSAYKAEAAVTSLYWTDASAGPAPRRNGLW